MRNFGCFNKHHNCEKVQCEAIPLFLSVHRPVAGLIGDIGSITTRDRRSMFNRKLEQVYKN